MEEKQIRPTKARLVGSILPNHTRLFQTTDYETFHVLKAPDTNTAFKDMSSVTQRIGRNVTLKHAVSFWTSEKKANGSSTATNNMKKVFAKEDGSTNLGVGYLTYYSTPLIRRIQDMEDMTVEMEVYMPHNYSNMRIGTLNSNHDDISEIKTMFYGLLEEDLDLFHTLSYRFHNKVCYVYIDNTYMNTSYDFTSKTGPLYIGGYCGSANLQGVNVKNIYMKYGATTP